MFLLGHRAKAASIDHPLGTTTALDDDATDALKNQMLDGDPTAADKIITGFTRMAISIAAKYVGFRPELEADLCSEALLAVTVAVQRIRDREVEYENISPYIIGFVHSRCSYFVRNDRLFGPSWSTRQSNKERGIHEPVVTTIDDETVEQITVGNIPPEFDLQECIDACTDCARQRVIIQRKLNGYTAREIANELEIDPATVSRSLNRFRDALGNMIHADFPTLR